MLKRILVASTLVLGAASCGGSGTSGTTSTTVSSSFTNDCERTLGAFAVNLLTSTGDMAPVKAQWPDNSSVRDLLETIYLISKPLMDKAAVGVAVNYMNEVITNSCRDNDVFNWVQKLEPGSDGYRGNCLDSKLPADVAKVEPCAADTTTTSAP